MPARRPCVLACTLLTLLAAALTPGTLPAVTPGSAPAATLLLPYFEVDLSSSRGLTTLFSVNNAGAEPTVAHVVLWTDWGIPTYSFDVVLGPDDVQTFNLRDLFRNGFVPATASRGLSGCTDPVTVPPLDATALRRRHSGRPDVADGLCYGSGRLGPDRATGFVTVDVTSFCSGDGLYFPSDPGYFWFDTGGVPPGPGIAAYDNVLWGDLFYVASDDDSAQGTGLVHVPFDPEAAPGETFYRIYSADGRDGRALLGSRYRGRFLHGGAFDGGTELLVWLEGDQPSEPVECGTRLGHVDTCQSAVIDLFDEEGSPTGSASRDIAELAFRLPVGGDELPAPNPFGFFELDHHVLLGCVIISTGEVPVQAWVTPVMRAEGRYSVGLPAARIPPADP